MSKFDPIRDCKHGHQKGKCDSCDLEQAANFIEQQQQRIEELEQRNNELSATVERLLKACELARDNYGKMLMTDPPQEAWKARQVTERLVEAIAATPQQNLNALKREVAREAFIDGSTDAAAFISQQLDLGKTDIDLDAGAAADKYVKTKHPIGKE